MDRIDELVETARRRYLAGSRRALLVTREEWDGLIDRFFPGEDPDRVSPYDGTTQLFGCPVILNDEHRPRVVLSVDA